MNRRQRSARRISWLAVWCLGLVAGMGWQGSVCEAGVVSTQDFSGADTADWGICLLDFEEPREMPAEETPLDGQFGFELANESGGTSTVPVQSGPCSTLGLSGLKIGGKGRDIQTATGWLYLANVVKRDDPGLSDLLDPPRV